MIMPKAIDLIANGKVHVDGKVKLIFALVLRVCGRLGAY